MQANILPPLTIQFTVPSLKQSGDSLTCFLCSIALMPICPASWPATLHGSICWADWATCSWMRSPSFSRTSLAVRMWVAASASMVVLNSYATCRFVTAFLTMQRLPFKNHLRQLRHFWCDWMRPRVAETKFGGGFLGSDFCWSFNRRAQRVAQCTGIFPVGVINASQFIFGGCSQVHGDH